MRCKELDAKIAHFQNLAMRLLDQPTFEAINTLVEEIQAEKAKLHPE